MQLITLLKLDAKVFSKPLQYIISQCTAHQFMQLRDGEIQFT